MPTANADTLSVGEIAGQAGVSGSSVLTNDVFGADDTAATHVVSGVAAGTATGALTNGVGTEIAGIYGTLTLNADGTYKYTVTRDVPNDGKVHEDTFSYTIKDADGDTSTATLTVNVKDDTSVPTITVPAASGDGTTVYEAGLADGSHTGGSASTAGSFTLTLNGEKADVTIGGTPFTVDATGNAVIPEGGTAINTGEGTLTITSIIGGKVSYTYALKDALTHPDGAGNNTLTDSIAISVTDQTHDTASADLAVTIVDDVPTLTINDTLTSVNTGDSYTSDTGTFDFAIGADGGQLKVSIDGGSETPVTFKDDGTAQIFTDNGTLTLDSTNGTYTYEAKSGLTTGARETFSFTATDNDGDTTTAALDVNARAGTTLTVGSNANDKDGSTTDYTVGTGTGVINGSELSVTNVIVGDTGGTDSTTVTVPGQTYNICFILDLSGSMNDPLTEGSSTTRLAMAKEALENFFKSSIKDHDGNVNIDLVGFSKESDEQEFTITSVMTADQRTAVYDAFCAYVNDLEANGGTNYDAALTTAANWYSNDSSVASNGTNMAFFLTDGEPTYYNDSSRDGIGGPGNATTSRCVTDAISAFQTLTAAHGGVAVSAIGLGTSKSLTTQGQQILNILDNTTSTGTLGTTTTYPYEHKGEWTTGTLSDAVTVGQSDLVNSAYDLTAALQKGASYAQGTLIPAGSDTINGGSSDYVYGDVINTDMLIAALGLESALPYGSGYKVFTYLENHHVDTTAIGVTGTTWTSADTINYIENHADQMGWETLTHNTTDSAGHVTTSYYEVDENGNVHNPDGTLNTTYTLDQLTGRAGGDDIINGGSDNDVIYGQEGSDTIHGGAGNDTIYGGTGDDHLYGDAGNDTIYGGAGNDDLHGGEGDDVLYGGTGNDQLFGDEGNDQLFGGDGNDILDGGAGNDYLDGGAGADQLHGGAGNDILKYDAADTTLDGGTGIDFLITDDKSLNLDSLLKATDPVVKDVEVEISGTKALSLTDTDALKAQGVELGLDSSGNETISLSSAWTQSGTDGHTFVNGDMTLQVSSDLSTATTNAEEQAAQVHKFVLEHGNG